MEPLLTKEVREKLARNAEERWQQQLDDAKVDLERLDEALGFTESDEDAPPRTTRRGGRKRRRWKL